MVGVGELLCEWLTGEALHSLGTKQLVEEMILVFFVQLVHSIAFLVEPKNIP